MTAPRVAGRGTWKLTLKLADHAACVRGAASDVAFQAEADAVSPDARLYIGHHLDRVERHARHVLDLCSEIRTSMREASDA